jgi:hypothetical protein
VEADATRHSVHDHLAPLSVLGEAAVVLGEMDIIEAGGDLGHPADPARIGPLCGHEMGSFL